MLIIKAHKDILQYVEQVKREGNTVGFVPTMGALHKGHISLIEVALHSCKRVVVSIFVNPTQFNNPEDLENYPRTWDADLKFLERYHNNVVVYAPSPAEVYGHTITAKSYNFGTLETVMEGTHRPGHFDGVGTVLNLLFRQVKPHKAFFGEKDYQQLLIVKKLVEKEKLAITIVGCPIYRQENGLAMSSRNERLTESQLAQAPFIHKTLKKVKEEFEAKSARELKKYVTERFAAQEGLQLEYFEIANVKNLSPLSRKRKNQQYRAFIAAFMGDVRLIDNIALN